MPRNPALDTKVKALQAQLLSEKDYSQLITASDLKEVIRYLKEDTHYDKFLADIDPETASRVLIEAAFSKIIIENTKKLEYYIYGLDKDFIKLILQRQDLENLLILLRALYKKENLEEIVKHLSFSEHINSVKLQNLVEDETWESFKKMLEGTIYYRSIETYSDLESSDLFELEKTFERCYYDWLYKLLRKLSTNENKNLVKLLRSEIDMLNLIWIYRSKKFYDLNVDQIVPFIYRGGLYLDEEDLYRIASIDNYDELLNVLRSYQHYDFLFNHEEGDLDLHMDRRKKRYMYYAFKKLLFFGRAMTAAYSFLRLLEDETYDITSIIEGKRYQINEKEMEGYLIRTIQK